MIEYTTNGFGYSRTMIRINGSVLPKAFFIAVPCSIFAAVCYFYFDYMEVEPGQSTRKDVAGQVLGGFIMVLGFLLTFRTQKAYSRYWECAMCLQKAKGEWTNAVSNLISFCSPKSQRQSDVKTFQHYLCRLVSLLFCSAAIEVAQTAKKDFEVLDISGMDLDCLHFLATQREQTEVVMQWIQRLVVDNMRTDVIDVAPPVVSRVFQEFSLGIVNIQAAKKIQMIPFPFPYSQVMLFLLTIQAILVPILAGYAYHQWWVASAHAFVTVLLSWSIHLIALEIEMPFGDDSNDLPVTSMVDSFNDTLATLLQDPCRELPSFQKEDGDVIRRVKWSGNDMIECIGSLERAKTGNCLSEDTIVPTEVAKSKSRFSNTRSEKEHAIDTLSADILTKAITNAASKASVGINSMLHGERHNDIHARDSAHQSLSDASIPMLTARIEDHLSRIRSHLEKDLRLEERLDKLGASLEELVSKRAPNLQGMKAKSIGL